MTQSAAPEKREQANVAVQNSGQGQPHGSPASPPPSPANDNAKKPGVMASIPRRQPLANKIGDTPPPKMKFLTFRASRGQALRRLFVWLRVILRFALGTLGDKLRGRDHIERRAKRLAYRFRECR